MAPSLDCTASLYCSEDGLGVAWEEEECSLYDSQRALVLCARVDVDEPLSVLIGKEGCHMPEADYLHRLQIETLDPRARQNAISWLLRVQARYNFGPLTAVLSVNYLDRFLSRHQMPNGKAWTLQLLSVACLSLAAKMEETDVPLLLDLQVEGAEFVFEPRTIQRMELLVLSTLDWRMSSVTAFSFLEYFTLKLGVRDHARPILVSRMNDLVLGSLKETRFLQYRPSAIAAAAALCAIEELLPVHYSECKNVLFSIPSWPQEPSEECLRLMEEVFVEPLCLTPKRRAFCSASTPQSPIGVLDVSFSCDSESNIRSLESRLRAHLVSPPVSKKRRVEDFCSSAYPVETL